MDKKRIILVICLILVFYTIYRYTLQANIVSEFNVYSKDNLKYISNENVIENFVNLLINDKFDEAYGMLDNKSKETFKSSEELKKYFKLGYEDLKGYFTVEKVYDYVEGEYLVSNYVVTATRSSSPQTYELGYMPGPFYVFGSLSIYEKTPENFSIRINLGGEK